MTTVGPKWPIQGSNTILGGPGPRKRVQNGGQNGPKIDQKNIQKKRLFLEAGSDAIFVRVLPISTPKWCQNGARWVPKSTQKPRLVEKAGFRSDIGKQVV